MIRLAHSLVVLGCVASCGRTGPPIPRNRDASAADAVSDVAPSTDASMDVVRDASTPCTWRAGVVASVSAAGTEEIASSAVSTTAGIVVGAFRGGDPNWTVVTELLDADGHPTRPPVDIDDNTHIANGADFVATNGSSVAALVSENSNDWHFVPLTEDGVFTGRRLDITSIQFADLIGAGSGYSAFFVADNPLALESRTFDATGGMVAPDQRIDGPIADVYVLTYRAYARTAASDGSFVASWAVASSAPGTTLVRAGRFSAQSVALSPTATIATSTARVRWFAMTPSANGLALTWTEQTSDTADLTVHFASLDANGGSTSTPTTLDLHGICAVCGTALATSGDDLLFAWLTGDWQSGTVLNVQPLDANGQPRGVPLRAATFGAGSITSIVPTQQGALVVFGDGSSVSSSDWRVDAVPIRCTP